MIASVNGLFAGITYEQAVAVSSDPSARIHYVGNAGHNICETDEIQTYKVNGRTKTWPTRPGHFRLPVKRGLRDTAQILHNTADQWHIADDCPKLNADNAEVLHLVVGHATGEHNAHKRKPGYDEEE